MREARAHGYSIRRLSLRPVFKNSHKGAGHRDARPIKTKTDTWLGLQMPPRRGMHDDIRVARLAASRRRGQKTATGIADTDDRQICMQYDGDRAQPEELRQGDVL
jgi:hypothetical protein